MSRAHAISTEILLDHSFPTKCVNALSRAHSISTERTLPAINIFDFIYLYLIAQGVEEGDYGLIPEDVKQHLKDDEYAEEIGAIIQEMDNNEIDALLSFIVEETGAINKSFSYPIIRTIYEHDLISKEQLMLIMGFSLEEPKSSEMLSGLLALGALGGLF